MIQRDEITIKWTPDHDNLTTSARTAFIAIQAEVRIAMGLVSNPQIIAEVDRQLICAVFNQAYGEIQEEAMMLRLVLSQSLSPDSPVYRQAIKHLDAILAVATGEMRK